MTRPREAFRAQRPAGTLSPGRRRSRRRAPGENRPDRWNASSPYGSRGFRPIVRSLLDEVPPDQGDYVFILDPTGSPVLVRTQNILDIQQRGEWATTATAPGQGANIYLQGPRLPEPDLGVVQASGGHAGTVFYVGGQARTLWSWQEGDAQRTQLAPGGGAYSMTRFFVDPYRPNLIYLLDQDHVKRSDDGGHTWQADTNLETQLTRNTEIPVSANDISSGLGDHFDLVLTDMQFDPATPLVRFAVGQGGAFGTNDGGASWIRLLHSGALPGRPANCYYDWITDQADPALYVALAGRSLIKLSSLFPPVII